MPLEPPPRNFSRTPLDVVEVDPSTLLRISKHATGEPYFGRSGGNRFDDPRKGRRFGTNYCGQSLTVAFAETILHDLFPIAGKFEVAAEVAETRYVVEYQGSLLRLANLTGVALKRSGIDSSLTTVVPPNLAQQWALALHRHPAKVDGLLYMSRHVNSERAVVLFDRAHSKVAVLNYVPFVDYPGALRTVLAFGVSFN